MYLCGPGKHNCQPFCGPEGRFYCSDSVCSLWPAPFFYLCVSVMILCVCWKLSAAEQVKTDCRLRLLWSPLYWLRCLCLVLWPLRSITCKSDNPQINNNKLSGRNRRTITEKIEEEEGEKKKKSWWTLTSRRSTTQGHLKTRDEENNNNTEDEEEDENEAEEAALKRKLHR